MTLGDPIDMTRSVMDTTQRKMHADDEQRLDLDVRKHARSSLPANAGTQ
jgi:hypothetical protein